jgi:hypothetical protein
LYKIHPTDMMSIGNQVLSNLLFEKEDFVKLESRMDRNYPRLVAQIVLSTSLMVPYGIEKGLIDSVSASLISAVYTGFKA